MTFADQTVIRLTQDPAQDGLPTVSPDGKYVAFVSNRGGTWQVWAVDIGGGSPTVLGPIRGNLTNWMEHAIQWVK